MSVDVSVVVLNFNGRDFLEPCIESLLAQTHPAERVEIVLVDNGSSDDSVDLVRSRWPGVRIHQLESNLGFAEGINVGVKAATGEIIALINNDARAKPDWIEKGLEGFKRGMDVGMVASKILTLDGKFIDFAGGALSFYGHGFKVGVGEADLGQYDHPKDTLFGSGCGLFIPRALFNDAGGFDGDYFAFFEDVDLGWRLWIMGYRVVYEPASVVFHHHHGTAATHLGRERELFLLERNALMTLIKNYDDERMAKLLPPALMLSVERGLTYSNVERAKYRLGSGANAALGEEEVVSTTTAAHMLGVSELARNLPEVMAKRQVVQNRRKRADIEILSLFQTPVVANVGPEYPDYHSTFQKVVGAAGVEDLFNAPTNVLVITGDTVSTKMAGPAIRAWEMSSELSRRHNVRLLVASSSGREPKNFSMHVLDKATIGEHLHWADVILFQGFVMNAYPQIGKSGKILIADLYDPFHLENLEMFRQDEAGRRVNQAKGDLRVINEQLEICDFFICASEKQRDFWLGQLTAMGRLNPRIYDRDPTLRQLIDVVPFGISSEPPIHSKQVLKGVLPGIGKDDRVILWGGGIYNWFDPLTLIRAMDQLSQDHPEVKLFFMGMSHPNPEVPEMRMATAAVDLSDRLGLTGVSIFFNRDWVPYEERANYLLESDIGISCHLQHVETTYSFRTRVLDYFWAELPIIVTQGDALSEIAEQHSLGLTVPPGDASALASAVRRMIEDEDLARECRLNISKLKPDLSWTQTIDPLVRFCSNPRLAPDKMATAPFSIRSTGFVRRLPRTIMNTWREGGPRLVATRSVGRLWGKLMRTVSGRRPPSS